MAIKTSMCRTIRSKQRNSDNRENKRQNRSPSEITTATVEKDTQSIESVDFTISTWKYELQDKIDETSNELNATIATNK